MEVDYQYWQQEDAKRRAKINVRIDACLGLPFSGIGKPEPLKGSLTGLWSRRIDRKYRLVYAVDAGRSTWLRVVITIDRNAAADGMV